jgi:sortase system peptidoglycan-associated protein
MKTKQLVIAMALTGFTYSSLASEPTSTEENRGAIAGLVVGAAVAGPFGAGVGAILGGGVIGKTMATNRLKREHLARLQSTIETQQKERRQLHQSIADLSSDLDRMVERQPSAGQQREIPIQFRTGSSKIEPHYLNQLNQIAQVLLRNPDASITLSGFADRRGERAANQSLSQKRVNNVQQFLVKRGVKQDQVQANAFGDTRPLQTDESLENNFFDRRVVLQLSLDVTANLATR